MAADSHRAGVTGAAGGGLRTLMLWTVVAVIVAAGLIGAAVIMTRRGQEVAFTPTAPSVVTPPDIASHGRMLGDSAAPVTIDLYEDFRCTGCFAFRNEIEPAVVDRYVKTGKAKMVNHDFIVIDRAGNTESLNAANAARCAADQGRYWPMYDWLFANQSPAELPGFFTPDRLVAIGKAAGMDMSTFERCVRNGAHNAEIQGEQGRLRSRLNSTPTIYVNGLLIVNPANPQTIPNAEQIGAAVDRELKP